MHISTNLKECVNEDMYNYINKHQLISKYFQGYSNFNTNNFNFNDGFNSFTRFKNVEDSGNNGNDYLYDYEMDEADENMTYNGSTNFFSKNR